MFQPMMGLIILRIGKLLKTITIDFYSHRTFSYIVGKLVHIAIGPFFYDSIA